MARVNTCNILTRTSEGYRYWRFQPAGGTAKQAADMRILPTDSLPAKHVVKGWNTLFSQTINVAWLPPDRIFLRVLQVPRCEDEEELRTLVEFQLERISPMPVAQMVWSYEPVPSGPGTTQQTVIVLLASRSVVEQQLAQLEAASYQPDRLEVPFLHELLHTSVTEDGVWIYPFAAGERRYCLTAFWTDRTLRSLGVVNLGEQENWGREIKSEIERIAWAGEFEGWLTEVGTLHLISHEGDAEFWQPAIERETGRKVQVAAPLAPEALANLNAERLFKKQSRANLLPEEYEIKYGQLVTDRIWMTGIGIAMICYMFVVAAYFGWVQYLTYERNQVVAKTSSLEGGFKEVQRMKAQKLVQQEQINLRYAALDGWLAVSEVLPTDITLTSLSFNRGNEFSLQGAVPVSKVSSVTDFNEALSKYTLDGRLLFKSVTPPSLQSARAQGGAVMNFDFTCELSGPQI